MRFFADGLRSALCIFKGRNRCLDVVSLALSFTSLKLPSTSCASSSSHLMSTPLPIHVSPLSEVKGDSGIQAGAFGVPSSGPVLVLELAIEEGDTKGDPGIGIRRDFCPSSSSYSYASKRLEDNSFDRPALISILIKLEMF